MDKRHKMLAGAVAMIMMIAAVTSAVAGIGRFTPTHAIVEPVYCGACHPEQVEELGSTTHLAHFAQAVGEAAHENGKTITQAQAIASGCMMCHNYWGNRETFGVKNLTIDPDNSLVTWESIKRSGTGYSAENTVLFWKNASSEYSSGGATYTRMDEVWGRLSDTSPNNGVAFRLFNGSNTSQALASCGNIEKGLCHAAESATGLSAAGGKGETILTGFSGNTNFYQHEMSYTTADYVGKQVKYCGVCHVNKLPPMYTNGTAQPALGGSVSLVRSSHGTTYYFNASWQSPEFAHKNVQCIRCHSHAGINNIGTGVESGPYGG